MVCEVSPQAKAVPPKNPSITQDLLVLGDVYLTLGWLAFQRLRYGPLWPWDSAPRRRSNGHGARNGGEPAPLRRR